jgi:hypothetical protein
MLFEAGEGLSVIACRRGKAEYTIGVANNSLRALPFAIRSRIGRIESLRESVLDNSEKTAVGYLPEGFEPSQAGAGDSTIIAGGDVRIFQVKLAEELADEIPHQTPPPRPVNRNLTLGAVRSVQEEILARPTFFQNYDGVVVDWRGVADRDLGALRRESGWVARNKLRVVVDLTSGINLYPDLRLVNNIEEDYSTSLRTVENLMEKIEALGSRDLIFALHRFPENNMTREEAWKSFDATVRALANRAQSRNITLHLRLAPGRPLSSRAEGEAFVRRAGAANLRLWE